jgi:hypothetical protein
MGFPEHSRATSPNRDYALVNVDRETEPYHTVLLENRKLKTRRELFMAEASTSLEPDSQSFAVKIWGYGELSPQVMALRASIPTQLVAAFGGRNHGKHTLDR